MAVAIELDREAPRQKSIAKLARQGAGRTPFAISGSLLAKVEMVRISSVAPFFVVPVEIDGEAALAMISTGTAEVVLDSSTRQEPSWDAFLHPFVSWLHSPGRYLNDHDDGVDREFTWEACGRATVAAYREALR